MRSNGGFLIVGGADLLLEANSVAETVPGFSTPMPRNGTLIDPETGLVLSSPPPFAVVNTTQPGAHWCCGAFDVVLCGNRVGP